MAKRQIGKNGKPKSSNAAAKPRRPFPAILLQDALKVAEVIRTKNNGHPFDSDLVATACGVGRKTNTFFYLSSAARDYGLTVGTRDTPKIELTQLGREIVFATRPDIEQQQKVQAFFNIEKFKQVYDHYDGSRNLPEGQYLSNALENDFGIAPIFHGEFNDVFTGNCRYLGIEGGLQGLMRANGAAEGTKATDVRIIGQPQGEFDQSAFVVMPFTERGHTIRPTGFFDEALKSVITPAANAAGFSVQTARREDSDIIHHTIINQLLNADLVIADLTDHNPNVLFELGIRIAKDKPVVLIKTNDTGRIFDVDNLLRVFEYNPNLWSSTVAADVKGLADRIKGTWEGRELSVSYMKILTAGPQAAPVH